MHRIFSSASKIVLVLFAASACIALFIGKINADQFVAALSFVFGYYFGVNKPSGAVSSR